MSLENRLREFKAALLDKGLSDELFVQRHIVYPTPFVFDGQRISNRGQACDLCDFPKRISP